MDAELSATVTVTPSGDEIASLAVREGEHHLLRAVSDPANGDVYLNFSTRRAMYDFAVSLLHEAVYGTSGQQEFFPLGDEEDWLVVNGVRMSGESSRLFVFYNDLAAVEPA